MNQIEIYKWVKAHVPKKFELRGYQIQAWTKLDDARGKGKKRAVVHLATGLGKTSVAAVDVMRFQGEGFKRALFVSHVVDISKQAQATFRNINPGFTTSFYKPRDKMPDVDIVFTTFQTLSRRIKNIDPTYFQYIVWDEAHHSEAATYKKVREHFDPEFQLALTATPKRQDNKDIFDFFGRPIFTKTLSQGIADGYLAEVDYHIVFDDAVKKAMQEGFSATSIASMQRLFGNRPRNEVIVEDIKKEQNRIGLAAAKTIIFCGSTEHADEIATMLDGKAYHSGIHPKERAKILEDFKSGSLQVICTRDMFNEGIDVPDARLIVFLRSTESPTVFEQQLGRGLRKLPGKTTVTILDFVANVNRIVEVRKLGRNIEHAMRQKNGQFSSDGADLGIRTNMDVESVFRTTGHATFEFDQMAVDLLKMYDGFNAPPAPEGYITVPQAARVLGISTDTVTELCAKHGWDLPVYRVPAENFGGSWPLISPERLTILSREEVINASFADDTVITVWNACRELRTSYRFILEAIEEAGVTIRRYRFGQGKMGQGVLKSDLPKISQALGHPPEGYMSLKHASELLKYHRGSAVIFAKKMGWELPTYKFGPNKGLAITVEQFEQMKEAVLKRRKYNAPIPYEDLLEVYKKTGSVGKTAEQFGVSYNAVKKRLVARGDYANTYGNWDARKMTKSNVN